MVSSFKEKNILDKVNKKLPYLFIPFIFLQMYSVGIRVLNHGLTEGRYLCIMLIIFEIIYIVIYRIKREKIGKILLVIVILTVISTIVPYINLSQLSILSQYHNLKIYKEKENYTNQDKIKIMGAYEYLNDSEEGKKYIDQLFNDEDIEKIEKLDTSSSYNQPEESKYYHAKSKLDRININGYNKIYVIKSENYSSENHIDFENITFQVENSDANYTLNLKEQMNNYVKNREDLKNYIKTHYEIEIDSNRKIVITKLSFRYYLEDNKVKRYSIYGYLLEK